ncbi:MAG TPA: hypothetical protein VFV08_14250 [Puia sp.]|nr:hypothetical protein [Puia sp.]
MTWLQLYSIVQTKENELYELGLASLMLVLITWLEQKNEKYEELF